jgi:hypothetical protein
MQYADTLFAENTLKVKIVSRKRSADLARTVIPDSRRTKSEAGIGNIELMSVTPGAALRNILSLKVHISRTKLTLYKISHRRAIDEFSHNKAFPAET